LGHPLAIVANARRCASIFEKSTKVAGTLRVPSAYETQGCQLILETPRSAGVGNKSLRNMAATVSHRFRAVFSPFFRRLSW
jgi:hypothetical protein